MTTRLHSRAIALYAGSDGKLPTQFRLFTRGWNDSEKGRFLFDDAAAASVMAAYREWGVDLAIDLEHQMLNVEPGAPDPTARDARGWCRLELRSDGSLWAVDVRWTPDGAARLTNKTQRYVSPAFVVDEQSQRIEKVLNVAITAMPATHNTPALVAASAMGAGCMDAKQVSAALDALEKGDAKAALEILKQMIATAAAGAAPDPDASTEDAPPPAGDGGADEQTESAMPPPADDAAKKDDEDKKTAVAATARIVRLSGKSSVVEALSEVESWRESHLALEGERQKLAAERATLESAERRQGCADLVRLAGRAPATVWADASATAPKKYLAAMSLPDFREYVADAIKSAPARRGAPATPPPAASDAAVKHFNVGGKTVTLDARELAICVETNCDPQTFATLKSRRTA